MEKLKAALERLAEAAEAAGLVKDERYALTQLTRLVPDQSHHLERLRELGGAEEEAASEVLPINEPVGASEPESTPETHDAYVFNSPASTPVGESEFEWSPVEDMAEIRGETGDEFEIERGFTFEAVVAEELAATSEGVAAPPVSDAMKDARRQELESVDFYIAQGYADIAIDTLDLLERQFGSHPDIDLRRRQLVNPGDVSEERASEPVATESTVIESPIVFDAGVPAPPAAQFGEIEFSMTGGFVTPEVAVPMQHVTPVALPVPQRAQGLDFGLAEIFEEHRVSAESEDNGNGNGDYETHYNLGLAYKEMDLFEEALEEFQVAAGLVTPDDGTSRYLQCCNLLGHCFMQKGVPQLAVKWFNKGFTTPAASEDERQALRYELAAAYEQVGDLHSAIDLFTEVYGINVSYRGVNERLRELKARANGENGKTAPASDRNKNHEQRVN
jgi:tetratricopeptide (TPR) repeat protein